MEMRTAIFLVILTAAVSASPAGAIVQEQVYRVGDEGVVAPSIEKEVKPSYTPDALTARVEGTVKLECVVLPGGSVSLARVVEPLHPSLDAQALRALSNWRFKPGTKDGKPVPVRVDIEMSFDLRDGPQPAFKGPALGSPEVFQVGNGVTVPLVIREQKPTYPPAVMRDGVQGGVNLECVVLTDGTVGDVRVTKPLHPELDEAAMRTLRQWIFKPGTKDGVAVPVQVEVEMHFRLGSGPPKSPRER
jgi:TonB family protein